VPIQPPPAGSTFIIMVEAPLTMACINPARDLGPHIAISILGWGAAAFPAWEDHGGSGRSAPGALAGGVAWSLAVQDTYQATRRTGHADRHPGRMLMARASTRMAMTNDRVDWTIMASLAHHRTRESVGATEGNQDPGGIVRTG
jgi:hypothetical protein